MAKGIERFEQHLIGRKFVVVTDHMALQTYWTTLPHLTRRHVRIYNELSRFDFTMEFIPGRENTLADSLSRLYCLVFTNLPMRLRKLLITSRRWILTTAFPTLRLWCPDLRTSSCLKPVSQRPMRSSWLRASISQRSWSLFKSQIRTWHWKSMRSGILSIS